MLVNRSNESDGYYEYGRQNLVTDTVENLILDLLEWLAFRERTYDETMSAWRTSCPRLPVWEDANDRGLVKTVFDRGCQMVRVTPKGLAFLNGRRSGSSDGGASVRK